MNARVSMTGGNEMKLLYEARDLPVFQNRMFETFEEAVACTKGNMHLIEDLDSGLVYNYSFKPELLSYDSSYQNEQAVSRSFEHHLNLVSKLIDREMGKAGLVEVGCGKGYFLELLQNNGFDVTGFDAAYEGNNPKIKCQNFEQNIGISARGIVLRHVLEHIQNPIMFLEKIRDANDGKGLIYIEVPCFDWICRRKAWFDVYYEHVNYFRMSDFRRMFGDIRAMGHAFSGQYIYVVAELESLKKPVFDPEDEISFPDDFLETLNKQDQSENAAIWGGASKGVIFSLLKSRNGHSLKTIIDINPAKQGKYIAVTGLRVYSPGEALAILPRGSTIFVMNSVYLEEIKTMSNHAYNYVTIDND